MSNANKKIVKKQQIQDSPQGDRQPTPVESAVKACEDLLLEVNKSEKPLTEKDLKAKVQKIRDKYYDIEGACVQELLAPYSQRITQLEKERELLKVQLDVMTEKVISA